MLHVTAQSLMRPSTPFKPFTQHHQRRLGRSAPDLGRSNVRRQWGFGTIQHAGRVGTCCARGRAHSAATARMRPHGTRVPSSVGMGATSRHRGHGFARNMGLPPYQRRAACSASFILPSAFLGRSGVGLGVVWGWSGGGLMWIAQSCDIQQLTRLATWLWVRLCAPCIDGAALAQLRRRPGEGPARLP
jgi:hypothetical protein